MARIMECLIRVFGLTVSRKTNVKGIIGTAGTKEILEAISNDRAVGTVAIGGINVSNVQRVLYQSKASKKGLDGVAVVSAIIAADDPKTTAAEFLKRIGVSPAFSTTAKDPRPNEIPALLQEVPLIAQKVVEGHPLAHSMINHVVSNFAANVILSM